LDSLSDGFKAHYYGFQVYFLYEVEKGVSAGATSQLADRSKSIAKSLRDYVMKRLARQQVSEALKHETSQKFKEKNVKLLEEDIRGHYASTEYSIQKACLKGML
jgi:hypothetical protein